MSRFYNALKEASRSQPKANGNPVEGDGALVSEVHELLADALTSTPATPSVLTAEPELIDTLAVPSDELPAVVPQSLEAPIAPKAKIVFDPKARLLLNAADSVVAEYYRRLRTKILQQQASKPFRSLIVVSPSPQEGKTVTVLNLGLSFASLPSFKVLVVDGDLRRGNVGKLLGVDDHPGLTDLVEGTTTMEEAVLSCDDSSVQFLMRGTSKLPPAELLHSPELGKQFRRLAEQFDLVLIDSAPVNLITDTQLLAGCCDAVLLIARAFHTTRKSMELAVQDLSQFRIIGSVLNGGPRTQVYRRYKGYY